MLLTIVQVILLYVQFKSPTFLKYLILTSLHFYFVKFAFETTCIITTIIIYPRRFSLDS